MYNIVDPDYFSIYLDSNRVMTTMNVEKVSNTICHDSGDYLLFYSYNLTNHTANSLTLRIKSD